MVIAPRSSSYRAVIRATNQKGFLVFSGLAPRIGLAQHLASIINV